MIKNTFTLYIIIAISYAVEAQNLPSIKVLRAEEDYASLLKNDSLRSAAFINKLKALQFNNKKSIYLSLGGEFRPRWEYVNNKNWSSKSTADEDFYSQRIMFHADLHAGKHVRFFGQLIHGLVSLNESVYTQI